MKQTKELFAYKLIELFPEKAPSLKQHYEDYGELNAHIFFSEEINVPLVALFLKNEASIEIKKYCRFIENMWNNGTDDIVNVVDVTIVERMSDDMVVWENFGKNITNDFIRYINEDLLINNLMLNGVTKLTLNNE